jgi:acyl-CoA thioester hydrolase
MTMPPAAARFELDLEVLPEDIDRLGHVNNVVYLRWVQDAAVAHWRTLATPAQQAALVWVVVRHEIDYTHPALPGDGIVVTTWVGAASRRTFERFTEIQRASDRRRLARARTLWCPLDRTTFKPVVVDDEVRARFSVTEARDVPAGDGDGDTGA